MRIIFEQNLLTVLLTSCPSTFAIEITINGTEQKQPDLNHPKQSRPAAAKISKSCGYGYMYIYLYVYIFIGIGNMWPSARFTMVTLADR